IGKNRGASTRSCRTIRIDSQQIVANASSDWAAAIENCTEATTPKSRKRPARSSQSDSGVTDGTAAAAASARIGFDRRFVDEHHRNVVLDRVDPMAGAALEPGAVLHQIDRRFTVG